MGHVNSVETREAMQKGSGASTRAEEHVAPIRGWYPDPWSAEPVRWWDGSRWTEYTTDRRDRGRAS
ncbi:MAG: DUF2510 domain-containing protein [Microthrixaceae bacterium]